MRSDGKLLLASTPTIVSSTEAEAHDMDAARAAGANHYLIKPLREDVLLPYAALCIRDHQHIRLVVSAT